MSSAPTGRTVMGRRPLFVALDYHELLIGGQGDGDRSPITKRMRPFHLVWDALGSVGAKFPPLGEVVRAKSPFRGRPGRSPGCDPVGSPGVLRQADCPKEVVGGIRPTVGYWVVVRAGEGLALLAAVGGALAVSHQLEHRLTTSPGPLTGLHSLQAAPSAPSVVFAAGLPAARRQRVTLPAVFSSRPAAAVTTPAREAPGAPQPGSSVPDGTPTRQIPPSPPAASPAPPAASPAPPAASPAPPVSSPPSPPVSAASAPAPALTAATSPARASTASGSRPSNAPSAPATKSLTASSTRPGWGRGDKNHNHTGPAGGPPSPTPTASSNSCRADKCARHGHSH